MTDSVNLDVLFNVSYGSRFDLKDMHITASDDKDAIAFVSRSRENLGVVAFVKPHEGLSAYRAGLITVALGGSYLLSAFIQERQFYTAQNVAVLTPRQQMSFEEKMYYCLCLAKNRSRYSAFGREANRTLAKIRVPASVPESFTETPIDGPVPVATPFLRTTPDYDTTNWREFRLSDLFEVTGTKTTPLSQLKAHGFGEFPYVTTKATENGVSGFYDLATEAGRVLVVDSAVIGFCSYQHDDFSASDHVEKLIPKFAINKYVALFLTTVINHNQYRYSYGRKASQTRLKKSWIRLPSTDDGQPDWNYMESCIRSLAYSRHI